MPTLNIKSTQQAIKVGEHKGEKMFVMRVEHYNSVENRSQGHGLPSGVLD